MFQSATIVVGISPEEIAEAVRQVRASRAVDVAGDPIHQTAASAASLQDRAAGRFVRRGSAC